MSLTVCNEFAGLPPENQTSPSGLRRANWSSWQSPLHRARLEGNAAPATPTPIPETFDPNGTWAAELSETAGNLVKKSQRSNISILVQTHFSEHSGTKLLEFEIQVCSETLPHLAIQDDQKRILQIHLRNISTCLLKFDTSCSLTCLTSIQLYVKVCRHCRGWMAPNMHSQMVFYAHYPMTPAKVRSIICSFSLLGCGKIQDDTTEIANLKKS